MYCIKCGKRLRPEQNYCDRCGTYLGDYKRIRKAQRAETEETGGETEQEAVNNTESPKENHRELYLVNLENDRKPSAKSVSDRNNKAYKLKLYEKNGEEQEELPEEKKNTRKTDEALSAKKKAKNTKRRQRRLIIELFVILIAFAALFGYLLYRNTSYVPGSRMIGMTSEEVDDSVFGNEEYSREEIIKVEFQDDLDKEGTDSWDISQNQDGTVMAWVQEKESGKVLVIAGKNGVRVDDCASMFANYTNLKTVKFNDVFFTTMCSDFSDMFFECESLTDLSISGLNTRNATDMEGMFFGCQSLEELNLSGFNTRKVENFSYMFADCTSLTKLNLTGFKTNSAVDASSMYFGCSSLKEVIGEPEFGADVITDDMYADSRIGETL